MIFPQIQRQKSRAFPFNSNFQLAKTTVRSRAPSYALPFLNLFLLSMLLLLIIIIIFIYYSLFSIYIYIYIYILEKECILLSYLNLLSFSTLIFSSLLFNMTGVADEAPVTLDTLKQLMAQFAKERDWDRFHSPRNLLLALVCFLSYNLWKKVDFFWGFCCTLLWTLLFCRVVFLDYSFFLFFSCVGNVFSCDPWKKEGCREEESLLLYWNLLIRFCFWVL